MAAEELGNVVSLLSGDGRDFLVRNNGVKIPIANLEGQVVALYFSASWCGPCKRFTPELVEVYNELVSNNNKFEVVFVSADHDEDSFNGYLSKMPWLAIPFSDDGAQKKLDQLFKVRGIPHLVILDSSGKILSEEGVLAVKDYGAKGYPFSAEKISKLRKDEAAKNEQTLRSLLVSPARDYLLSICGLKLAGRLIFTCSKGFCRPLMQISVQLQGIISRVKRTMQGSSDDIGWLQKAEQPPVEDGTTHFMELLHDVRNGIHRLPDNLIYLLIPGLFSNHSPLYFVNTKKCFSKMGLTCHIAKIHSEASVERNSWELKEYIEELYGRSGKRVMLLGHSKGGVDAAAALSIYWSDLKNKVAGLALVQSPYGGSPIASDILREGQVADKEARRVMEFIICKIIKGDMRSLEDLTYEKRRDFISKYRLPVDQVPVVSFHTEARVAPGVIATMSRIAHAELRWIPLPYFSFMGDEFDSGNFGRKVPVVFPLAAAMAISALHLKLRYGEESDGLVTRRDAEVPGSVVVRLQRKLDHSWMVYSTKKKNQLEADATEMCQALLAMLLESGREGHGDVPVSDLEGKIVALYFSVSELKPCVEFTRVLAQIYGKLKELGQRFQVVLVPLDDDESSFEEALATMPWLTIPFQVKSCKQLARYFGLGNIPTVVVIGADGKTMDVDFAEFIEEHGVEAWEAFPFS